METYNTGIYDKLLGFVYKHDFTKYCLHLIVEHSINVYACLHLLAIFDIKYTTFIDLADRVFNTHIYYNQCPCASYRAL